MKFRNYNPKTDKKAIYRMWHEVGWIGDGKEGEQAIDAFLKGSRALVAEINHEAECLANSMPGVIRYLAEDLSLSAVTAVLTSRIKNVGRPVMDVIEAVVEGHFEGGVEASYGFAEGGLIAWFSSG